MAPAPRTPVPPPRRRLSPAVALLASLALAGCATAPQQHAQTGSARMAERSSMQAMLQLAARTESSGNTAAAREIYGEVAARYPEQPAGYLGLARTSYRSGDPAEAAQHYRTALTYAPDSVDARYGLGKALLASDRPEAAIEQFDRLIGDEAADTRPYVAKGVALDMIGRHAEAQAVYRSGLELGPMNVALRTNLGLSLALAGDYKTALRVLEDAARDPKATARTRQNLALVYGLAGEMEDAAATGSADLGQGTVQRNLAYYRALRSARAITDAAARTRAVPEASDAPTAPVAARLRSHRRRTRVDDCAPRRQADETVSRAPAGEAATAKADGKLAPTSDPVAHGDADTPAAKAQPAEVVEASFSPAPAPDHALAGTGRSYWVQVASLRSERDAKAEWRRLKGQHGALLAELPLKLQKTDLPEKGTYYRLRSGPFADAGTPKQLCAVLQARDQACLVVHSGPAS
ncbi:MAG: tetratricopeptide repeat protein [Rhodovibrio sp.]|nr:tetratricopeptide repeat protein [Rhodovibrio sp.]